MDPIPESLQTILDEFERLADIVQIYLSEDPSDLENLEKYATAHMDEVLDFLYKDPIVRDYAKQMFLYLDSSDQFRKYVDFLKDRESLSIHSEIADQVLTFLDGEKSASLTYTLGFGDQLVQIFPQDKEYVDKVFRTHKKNVILGFGYFAGGLGVSENGGNLFSVNANVPNSKRLKERTCAIFQSTFGLEKKDIRLTKYKDFGLLFTFSKDGSDYLFYWVNLPINSLKLLYFYKPMLDAFDERYIIDTTASGGGKGPFMIRTNKFIGDYFKASLFRFGGENIGTFQNDPYSLLITKDTIKGTHPYHATNGKNIWNGFGGNRKTRRRSIGARGRGRARKQQTRGKK